MPQLPSYRRVREQDYPSQYQDLIKQLAVTLNYGFDALYQLLNGKLTFADNMDSVTKTVTLQVDSSGVPTSTVNIGKSSANSISGIIVAKVVNLDDSNVFPTSGVTVSYTETVSSVTLNHITGLQANANYSLTIVTLR